MIRSIALALLALSAASSADAAPKTAKAPAPVVAPNIGTEDYERPPVADVCARDRNPFALPLVEMCDDCGDAEFEALAASMWSQLCAPSSLAVDAYARAVCACVPVSDRF